MTQKPWEIDWTEEDKARGITVRPTGAKPWEVDWSKEAPAPAPAAAAPAAPPAAPAADPYDAGNTWGRVWTGGMMGAADLVSRLDKYGMAGPFSWARHNAQRLYENFAEKPAPGFLQPAPVYGDKLRELRGIAELPPDAPIERQLGEGALSALFPGPGTVGAVSQAVRAAPTVGRAVLSGAGAIARNIGGGRVAEAYQAAPTVARGVGAGAGALARDVVLPTLTGHVGGTVGGAIGGEEGALLLGLAGGTAPSTIPRGRAALYARRASPDAREVAASAGRLGYTPTAGQLGDARIKMREKAYESQNVPAVLNAREAALVRLREAADRSVANRRMIPNVTPESQDVATAARAAQANGADVASAVQEVIMNKVGPTMPVDVQAVADVMRQIIRPVGGATDIQTARPIAARLAALEAMMPVINGQRLPFVTYQQFKDWRTNLGVATMDMEGISSFHHRPLYDAATEAMRNTAQLRGVHPNEFNLAQDITRMHHEANTLAENIRTTLGGETPQTRGSEGAAAPRSFHQWFAKPETQETFGSDPVLRDVATGTRAYDYPTSQTGLGRSQAATHGTTAAKLGLGGLGAYVGHLFGIPGGEIAGGIAGSMIPGQVANIRGRMLEGATPRRGLTGAPPPATSWAELMAAIQAANASAKQQVPQWPR